MSAPSADKLLEYTMDTQGKDAKPSLRANVRLTV